MPAPRAGSLLVWCKLKPKAVPAGGESGHERSEWPKGERLGAAKLFYYSPSASLTLSSSPASGGAFNSLSQTYGLPAPSTGSLLVRLTSLHIKPALKGEVGFAQAKAGGVEKESRFAWYRQPLSLTSFDSSP